MTAQQDQVYAARTVSLTPVQAAAVEHAQETGSYARNPRVAAALVGKGVFESVEGWPGWQLTELGRVVYDIHPRITRRV